MAAAKRETRQDGYGEKITVKIMAIDKANNRVEAATKDGAMIYVAVWETGTVFRWPEAGEVWTVRKDVGVWRLGEIVQSELMEVESESTPINLEDLPEGDTRIQGETVHVQNLKIGGHITAGEELVPTVRAYATGIQTIPTGQLSTLTLGATRYDTHAMRQGNRLVAPIAGIYDISASLSWFYTAVGGTRFSDIVLNGIQQLASLRNTPNSTGAAEMTYGTQYKMLAGDYIELRGYQDCGANLNTATNNLPAPVEFSMTYIGNPVATYAASRPDTASAGYDWGIVTGLPTTKAYYGDYCSVKVGTGSYWRLLYTGEETYPWAKIGGPPLTSQNFSSVSTEAEIATSTGTSITTPLAMVANVAYGSNRVITPTSGFAAMFFLVNGALQAEISYTGTAIQVGGGASKIDTIAIPKGAFCQNAFQRLSGTGPAQLIGAYLEIDPIRVG